MITVYPVLRQRMRDCEVSHKALAAIADVDIISLHLKMIGIKQWKLSEALRICCFFRTHDVEHLFEKGYFCSRTL